MIRVQAEVKIYGKWEKWQEANKRGAFKDPVATAPQVPNVHLWPNERNPFLETGARCAKKPEHLHAWSKHLPTGVSLSSPGREAQSFVCFEIKLMEYCTSKKTALEPEAQLDRIRTHEVTVWCPVLPGEAAWLGFGRNSGLKSVRKEEPSSILQPSWALGGKVGTSAVMLKTNQITTSQ